jgi:hypothetical protein
MRRPKRVFNNRKRECKGFDPDRNSAQLPVSAHTEVARRNFFLTASQSNTSQHLLSEFPTKDEHLEVALGFPCNEAEKAFIGRSKQLE